MTCTVVFFFFLHIFRSFPHEVLVGDKGRVENVSHDDRHIAPVYSPPPLLTAMTAIECRTQLV